MAFKLRNLLKRHLNQKDIARYVDALDQDELSNLSNRMLRHVEHCARCKDQILDILLTLKSPSGLKKTSPQKLTSFPPDPVRLRSPLQSLHRMAASFFILGCLVAFYFTVIAPGFRQKSDDPGSPAISPARAAPEKDRQLSEPSGSWGNKSPVDPGKKEPKTAGRKNYEINPNLELMINSHLRNETIHVLSPRNQSIHAGAILFSWKPFDSGSLELKILNNKNEIIFRYTLNQNRFTLEEKLPPGLYYWKLESAADLLYVGKFIIKNGVIPRGE